MLLAQAATHTAAASGSSWTSLEIVKLIVAGLTPLSVALVACLLNRWIKRVEHLQWGRQKVIEKRIALYDALVPLLNDLLCYFTFIGNWKEVTPPEIVKLKRTLDRLAHVYAPLLPPKFRSQYDALMSLCFATYQDWGRDARLRTKFGNRQDAYAGQWEADWAQLFADEDCAKPQEISKAYGELVAYLANELGVGVAAEPVKTGRIPANIR